MYAYDKRDVAIFDILGANILADMTEIKFILINLEGEFSIWDNVWD